jgi:hypothetical protein
VDFPIRRAVSGIGTNPCLSESPLRNYAKVVLSMHCAFIIDLYRAEQVKNCPRGGSAGRIRKVPPGEPARSMVPIRGRTELSLAAATARSLRRRRDALNPVHSCYIALCVFFFFFVSSVIRPPKIHAWVGCRCRCGLSTAPQ